MLHILPCRIIDQSCPTQNLPKKSTLLHCWQNSSFSFLAKKTIPEFLGFIFSHFCQTSLSSVMNSVGVRQTECSSFSSTVRSPTSLMSFFSPLTNNLGVDEVCSNHLLYLLFIHLLRISPATILHLFPSEQDADYWLFRHSSAWGQTYLYLANSSLMPALVAYSVLSSESSFILYSWGSCFGLTPFFGGDSPIFSSWGLSKSLAILALLWNLRTILLSSMSPSLKSEVQSSTVLPQQSNTAGSAPFLRRQMHRSWCFMATAWKRRVCPVISSGVLRRASEREAARKISI